MYNPLSGLYSEVKGSAEIYSDVLRLLSLNGCEEVADHSLKVANRAKSIARYYGINEESAFVAGLLHDIGNIIPLEKRVALCSELGIGVLEEEQLAPAMLHPKLSKIIARDIFLVDEEICNAIECHSTLKADAGKLDMVLFVADKISWDRSYSEGFIDEMLDSLNTSLECSALEYLKYLHSGKAKVMHPWTIEAYSHLTDLCEQ
ncbi:MAG TPA: bis(5'-nucleosyl)-tetraphosphatase (symmetrical) YqeK [Clostridia bacterium]|nr:bis(5'-nucleosyl)-tetraphosphatase (symmetrical) YqeK [Clostridia bacterium]